MNECKVHRKQEQPEKGSVWQNTPFVILVRYKPSQVYFARIRINGKLVRRSLKTNQTAAAKLRLADFEKSERQKAHSANAVANGKMTFGDALAVFQARVRANPAIKPRTKEYCAYRITHHDLRHLFATRYIESGVDIPTVSPWLRHKDGGALAMKVHDHLRNQHSVAMVH